MSSIFDGLFHRYRTPETPLTPTLTFGPYGPVHWLDVTPRESKDRPCTLESLDISARVSGLYAEVTQKLVLANPNTRPISVPLAIPLPDRAVVSGYALEIDGQMIDGVVVEQEKARVAFETEQRRGVDPGLVEAVRGNLYRTRVYPVPALGTRAISLRYVTPLVLDGPCSATLELPMPAEHLEQRHLRLEVEMLDVPRPVLRGIGEVSLQEAQGLWVVEHEDGDLTPSEPICISLPELPPTLVTLERDGAGDVWFSASEETRASEGKGVELTHLTVLWDASGSRSAQSHDDELKLLSAWCAAPTLEGLTLVVFADRVREVREFSSAKELVAYVRELAYDAGTDFAALARAVSELPETATQIAQGGACVLFSDGLDTLTDAPLELPQACDTFAIVTGTERDAETLRQACRGLAFDLAHAPADADALAQALDRTNPARSLSVRGTGIADVLDAGAADGGRRAVMGRLTANETQVTLGADGTTLTLKQEDARQGDVLARAWAARRVALLSPRATENAEELLALGKRFGVASPATSLLVLETLDQWLRYEIEPPKSWASMHESWERAAQGGMKLSSEQQRRDTHRSRLEGAWADVMRWWAGPMRPPFPRPNIDIQPAGFTRREGANRCPNCGSPLDPGLRFCLFCGANLRALRDDHLVYSQMASSIEAATFADVFEEEALPDAMGLMASEGASQIMAMPDSAPTAAWEDAPQPTGMPDFAPSAASAAPEPRLARIPRHDSAARAASRADAPRSSAAPGAVPEQEGSSVSVRVKAWNPDASYLKKLDRALEHGAEAARETYLKQRTEYRDAPSFFFDCANWFMTHDDEEFGISVLTNLAEMRIEDAALLRMLGWRLREAGRLERALVVLRHVLRLRGEDSQSHRDVALVLAELAREAYAAGNEAQARRYAEEAGELYRETALTPWQRRPMAIGLFAVEEYNVLRTWAEAQSWKEAPELPSLGSKLEGVPDCDLRITLAWDADETDVDIHVTEPSGEEAYYGHRFTSGGGRVSEDITDGYGPELYEVRHALDGVYTIRTHYFASHQQAIFGPATCTLTVYTDWGRPEQAQTITSTRLDKAKEMTTVGTTSYGAAASAEDDGLEDASSLAQILPGMTADEVRAALGDPDDIEVGGSTWVWKRGGGRKLLVLFDDGKVVRISEAMPWGEEMVIAQ